MITHNNWVTSNILEHVSSTTKAFRAHFDFKDFMQIPFWDAAFLNTKAIREAFPDRQLYVALSGGADSELVFDQFQTFYPGEAIPVIIASPMNSWENEYAFHICRKHKVIPRVINIRESEVINYFINTIYGRLGNSIALNTVFSLFASQWVQAKGMIINGDSILHDWCLYDVMIEAYDFFPDVLFPNTTIPFFYYTSPMAWAVLKEIKEFEETTEFKARLYKQDWRPKFEPNYSEQTMQMYRNVTPSKKLLHHNLGSVKNFVNFALGEHL